jgi:hypothetical protein
LLPMKFVNRQASGQSFKRKVIAKFWYNEISTDNQKGGK